MNSLVDVTGSAEINMEDAARIRAIAALSLFKKAVSQDLDGDNVAGELDAAKLKKLLNDLYVSLNVSTQEQAIFDINHDGVINFIDIRLILEANSYYGSSDLTGDGIVNELDVERLTGEFSAIYSEEILTEEIRAYADLNKDGMVDDTDIALFADGLKYYRDLNGDVAVDIKDLNLVDQIMAYQSLNWPNDDQIG